MKDLGEFANVPLEEDTKVSKNTQLEIKGLPALHQQWTWEGISAESLIFHAKDVGHLDDEGLIKFAGTTGFLLNKSDCTISRDRDGYTLVNFNFVAS